MIPEQLVKMIESIAAENKQAMQEMHAALQLQRGDLKKHGETTDSTRQLIAQVETAMKLNSEAMQELKGRIETFEVKANRPDLGIGSQRYKTLGEMFTDSKQYTEMRARKAFGCEPFNIGEWAQGNGGFGAYLSKATPVITLTGNAALGDNLSTMRLPNIIAPPLAASHLRDFIPVTPTTSNAIDYVEEVGFSRLYTECTAIEAIGEVAIAVDNAQGFYPGQAIVVSGEDKTIAVGGVNLTTNVITVTVGMVAATVVGDAVTSTNYVMTPESGRKPNAKMTFDEVSRSVRTLASWIAVTRQVISDIPRLQSAINNRLLESLASQEDRQILSGDGTANQLSGILTNARIQTYAWSAGTPGDTKFDALRRAITLARIAEYKVDLVVVNPADKEDLDLQKGDDGHYIWVQMPGTAGFSQIWSVPVIESTGINAGTALVGCFKAGAELFDREESSVRTSEHHDDFFVKNQVAVLAEERIALAVYRPEGFVAVSFDEAPAEP